jgi:hypothetical protein
MRLLPALYRPVLSCRRLTTTTNVRHAVGRTPLPPMPRVLPAAAATPIKAQTFKKGGGFLITSGWILLGVLALDQGLQFLDRREAHQAVAELQRGEAETRRTFYEDWKDKPTLFETVVRFEYKVSDDAGYRKCGMPLLGRRPHKMAFAHNIVVVLDMMKYHSG